MTAKILIVDDDPDIVTVLEDRLHSLHYATVVARDGQQALDQIAQESPHVVLLDLTLPKLTGLDVLKRLHSSKHTDTLPVIVMTAHGSVHAAVEAMKEGAYDFLTKPLDKDHLLIVIRKALERDSLRRQVDCLRSEVAGRYASIVGNSPSITSVMDAARRAAKSDASVLLLGESGTGKELFARSIHHWSPRETMPLIVINCVALTETLLENALLGHERGAFTGADRQQKGKLEMADGGTVFLDEIGDMSLPLQAKLLRVLQDREFHRVGGSRTVSVNIRIIAATNKDLKKAVKAGQFREDLYFRLNVITFTLPPLRERRGDIPALARFFLDRHTKYAKRPGMTFSHEALDTLTRYAW
ncbi:MAG: sigma-54-dependent Fis family transcriptional regulator, partial [Nitrospira sp.]|nr:sigma-54-dependent Fis family transcriptional regulator [Nitrospira sp.]